LAVQYARTLAFSAIAEQQGLDKNPALIKELDIQLKMVRMRVLASAFLQNLQARATAMPESDIQTYYNEHQDQYEQVRVRRLAVPIVAPTESGRPLDRSEVKSEIVAVRERAVAGEDLDQLLQDAFKHLHIQAAPPKVSVLTLRRRDVQGDEAKALDLKAGEISAALDLPAAIAIIKIESKEPVPIESVRPEIEAALRGERLKSAIGTIAKNISAQFNLQYLDMSSQPDIFAPTAITPVANRAGARRPSGARPYSPPR
jgi:hypothetical protein